MAARPVRASSRCREAARLGGRPGTGTRRGPWQRRPGSPRRHVFWTRWQPCSCPQRATGCDTSTASFASPSENGWQTERPDNWLRRDDPAEVARPNEQVEIKLGCSFELRGGRLRLVPGAPSTPSESRSTGRWSATAGKTIDTLRLWAAAAPDYFDFQRFSQGEFVEALEEKLARNRSPGCCIPTIPRVSGQALRLLQEYFLVACSLGDLVRRFRKDRPPSGAHCRTRWRFSSTTRTPRSPFPS